MSNKQNKQSHLRFNMEPATIETFEALTIGKARHNLKQACWHFRNGYHKCAFFCLGIADAQVSILYDILSGDAYRWLQRVDRVRNLMTPEGDLTAQAPQVPEILNLLKCL